MRRLLVALAVLLAAVGGVPIGAGAAPADNDPASFGTFDGVMDCDVGWCTGELVLTGRFVFTDVRPAPLTDSIQTTATLQWQGRDDSYHAYGTITSPRFDGTCEVRRQGISVDPVVGVQHSHLVVCTALIDGGPSGGNLELSFETEPVDPSDPLGSSHDVSGWFFPPIDPYFLL